MSCFEYLKHLVQSFQILFSSVAQFGSMDFVKALYSDRTTGAKNDQSIRISSSKQQYK